MREIIEDEGNRGSLRKDEVDVEWTSEGSNDGKEDLCVVIREESEVGRRRA